jgi:hypothetical protein
MIFRNRMRNNSKLVPVATMFLVVSILWPYCFHPTTRPWTLLSEGARGMMFGICFGINIFALVMARRQRRCGSQMELQARTADSGPDDGTTRGM